VIVKFKTLPQRAQHCLTCAWRAGGWPRSHRPIRMKPWAQCTL